MIRKGKIDKDKIKGSLKIAEHFMKRAEGSYKIEYYDTALLMAYNSLFHTARSLLFSKGYTERSHTCLVLLLKKEFTNTEVIEYIRAMDNYRIFREMIQYSGEGCSNNDAKEAIDDAKNFLEKTRVLLKSFL